jgi:hypothetical protein
VTFLEHVTTYWVGLVGRGAALSSADLALVRQWEAAGLPVDAVCRALGRAAEARRGRRTSLADCAYAVERLEAPREARETPRARLQSADASGAEAAPWTPARLLGLLEVVGRSSDEGPLRETYRAIYRLVQALPAAPLDVAALSRLDELAVRELEGRLSSGERARLRADTRREAKRLLGAEAKQDAVRRLARSLLETACCETFGLALPSALLTRREGT